MATLPKNDVIEPKVERLPTGSFGASSIHSLAAFLRQSLADAEQHTNHKAARRKHAVRTRALGLKAISTGIADPEPNWKPLPEIIRRSP